LDHLVSSNEDSELPLTSSTLSLPSGAILSIKSEDGYKHTKSYTFGLEPTQFTELMLELKRDEYLSR